MTVTTPPMAVDVGGPATRPAWNDPPTPTSSVVPLPPQQMPPDVTTRSGVSAAVEPPPVQPVVNAVPAPALTTPAPAPVLQETVAPPVAATPLPKHDPEPPLAPTPGPTQVYQVHMEGETLLDIAKKTLPPSRVGEVAKLNPMLKPEVGLTAGFKVKLPTDACIPAEDADGVKPLPALQPTKGVVAKAKTVLPLTGTYPCTLDDKRTLVLPKALREQLGVCDTVVLSPGPDQCLWLTNQAHLDRLAQKLEASQAREIDIRVFKRLYFAQAEKTSLGDEGKVSVSDRLAQFAGLSQEVILIGTDDHFEVWDASRWKTYTQQKSAHIDE